MREVFYIDLFQAVVVKKKRETRELTPSSFTSSARISLFFVFCVTFRLYIYARSQVVMDEIHFLSAGENSNTDF